MLKINPPGVAPEVGLGCVRVGVEQVGLGSVTVGTGLDTWTGTSAL